MREVSQKWLNNQNKTLRDQGLLRLDFLSAHNNNAYAHIIPMGSDANKSNINEIKEIYPYGAPTKNLAMPNLMGKTEISAGVYRLYDENGITIDYDYWTGEYNLNGTTISQGGLKVTQDFVIHSTHTYSYKYISGTKSSIFSTQFYSAPDDLFNIVVSANDTYSNTQSVSNRVGFINIYFESLGTTFTNYKFKLQLEKGTTATDYVVPQPNTGYVSSAITNHDGTLTPAGSNYYTLDQPIAELNNHTLREVFESNRVNLLDTNPEIYQGTLIGNEFTITTGLYAAVFKDNSIIGDIYYRYYDVIAMTDNISYVASGGSTTLLRTENLQIGQRYVRSGFENSPSIRYHMFLSLPLYSKVQINQAFQINVSTLGIDHLTKERMDYWFSVYQAAKVVPIEVNVENYRSPLNGLTITWSENFGHAVDYSIEYNGELYNYYGNTKKTVFVPIIVENTPDANFKIRVHKWSQGNVPIRIERIFVGLHIINYQDRIFSYTKKRVNDVLSLELPQDEINFELSNIDRMFDPLWYNSYFKYLNEKTEIRVYSGFRLDGKNDEWIKNGTFYLTEWKAPNNSITASFTARDILNLLDADEMYSKSGALTLDDYCDIILGRDYKGVDNFEDYNLPVNPDGSKKWNIRKNLAVPDLTGKPEISEGVYRLYDTNGVTVDYNYWTGEFIFNGTATGDITTNFSSELPLGVYVIKSYSSTPSNGSFRILGSLLGGAQNRPQVGETSYTDGITTIKGIDFWIYMGYVMSNMRVKVQIEAGTEATDYELPIENASVPVSMETRTKREVLQLLAQSVNAHIHLDDDANISFIRDVTGQQLDASKKIMTTKPEFNIAAPVKKIIVPISTYASDPNELELARIQVTAGEVIEINHDLPYSGGRVEVSGSLAVASQDNTWFRSYKIVVGGSGSGELVLFRHQMARTTINILQDVGSSGTSMTYENPMIDTKLKASRALTKIWSEISNSRQVEFDLRIDPLFNTLDAVSFPFKVLNLEQSEFMRIDELEINYNGAYKGKIKGVILSNYGGDLTDKTYIKHTKEFNSGEENLKWHLSNK